MRHRLTVVGVVNEAIRKAGGVRALARILGCSPAHVSDMRLGKRCPGPALQEKLGIRIDVVVEITRTVTRVA